MILLLSTQHDISTDMVMDWLILHNIPVLRINGDEEKYSFYKIDSNGVFFKDNDTKEIINLCESSACWWRRSGIRSNQFYPIENLRRGYADYKFMGINPIIPNFIKNELGSLYEYVTSRLYNEIPINLGTPRFNLNRLEVLDAAKCIGLQIPAFEVITSSLQLCNMQNTVGDVVAKAINNGIYDVIGNERYYTYTELIEPDFANQQEEVLFAPSLLMQLVNKKYEIRTFFIDGTFYSMAIFSQSSEDARIDFRINPPRVEVPYKLPAIIEQKLRELYRKFGLNTGSADLLVNEYDEYVFLEINPVGQFGMTSIPCNYNLEELIAKYLINGTI